MVAFFFLKKPSYSFYSLGTSYPMKAMTYRFRAIRCPAYNSLLGPGEGRALRQARDAKRGRDPRRELEAAGGRRGAGFAACPFLRAGGLRAPEGRIRLRTPAAAEAAVGAYGWLAERRSGTARSLQRGWGPAASLRNKEKSCAHSSCYLRANPARYPRRRLPHLRLGNIFAVFSLGHGSVGQDFTRRLGKTCDSVRKGCKQHETSLRSCKN